MPNLKILKTIKVPASERDVQRGKSHIYVWKKNEHVLDTILRTERRPDEVSQYRRVVPSATRRAGIQWLHNYRWSVKNGRPGFIADDLLMDGDTPIDLHVIVDEMDKVLEAA